MPEWRDEIRRRVSPGPLHPSQEDDIVEELAQHLDDRYSELKAAGFTEDEARRTALAEIADSERLVRDLHSAARPGPTERVLLGAQGRTHVVADIAQDARVGLRMLAKAPGFSVVAILTLAVGLGASTAVFSLINTVMLRPLPFGHPERLVRIWESNPSRGWPEFSASHPNYLDWVDRSRSFEELAATTPASFTAVASGEAERLVGAAVTHRFLPALGIAPAIGRNFLPEEDRPSGTTRVAIISDGLWQRRFGRDPAILERTLLLRDATVEIVGVLPASFAWGSGRIEVLVPLGPNPARPRADHRLLVIGKLKPDVSIDQAVTEMRAIAGQLERQYPESNDGWTVLLRSFNDWLVPSENRRSLKVFLAAVICVLLIACGNVANLLLARATARHREIAVRIALGASRARIVRQLLVEALLLALIGGAVGLAVAIGSTSLLQAMRPEDQPLPRLEEVSLDLQVLAFGFGVSLVTGLLFGLAPAFAAVRGNVSHALKEGGRGDSAGTGRQRVRSTLVVAEMALSVALLVAAALLLRSFWQLQYVNPGFQSSRLLTMRLNLPASRYDTNEKAWTFYVRLLAALHAVPGVRHASITSNAPLAGGNTSTELQLEGRTATPGDALPSADWRIVAPGYFRTMGIRLRGREFADNDTYDRQPVTIISESMARRYWPNDDPIGKTLVIRSFGNVRQTIVGVAGDVRSFGLEADPRPMVYAPTPAAATWNPMYLVIRTMEGPELVTTSVRAALRSTDATVPMYDVATADELLSRSLGPRRFAMLLLGCFAAVAMLLASIGLFGVLAYLVSQRRRDIGIRLALGAPRSNVMRLIVGKGLRLTLCGVALGVTGALWLTPALDTFLFGVRPRDVLAFVGAPALLVVVAALACYLPARRAMRTDPMTVLRSE